MFRLLWILSFVFFATLSSQARNLSLDSLAALGSSYPADWWKPFPKDSAASWEVLPQDAGPGEVILSKRTELGVFSNFAPTSFVYNGKKYASIEGFWQMMKYPEGPDDERLKDPTIHWTHTREQVAQMTSFEAKSAGSQANENMKKLKISWVTFEGHKINYLEASKGEFYRLIWDAENAKMNQNPEVKSLLLKTRGLKLLPDHHQSPDSAPAWKYHEIWMEIRSQLETKS